MYHLMVIVMEKLLMQACSEMKKNPGREEGGGVYKNFFDQLG